MNKEIIDLLIMLKLVNGQLSNKNIKKCLGVGD